MRKLFIASLALCAGAAFAAPANKASTMKSAKKATGRTAAKTQAVKDAPLGRPRIIPQLAMTTFEIGARDVSRTEPGVMLSANGQIDRGMLGFVAGVGYLQTGGKETYLQGRVKASILFDYLMFNAGVKAYSPNRRFYGIGGVSPLINLHSTYDLTVQNGTGEKGKVDNVRDMDILARAGAGFEYPMGTTGMRMGAELTYNRGLLDIRTGPGFWTNQGFIFSGFVSL